MPDWTYYEPVFEHQPPPGASWSGHRRFAYDLVRNLRPARIAELGVCWGTSLFAFCQAVKDAGLTTEIHAVDTWQGDANTGQLGPEVLESVRRTCHTLFPRQHVRLVRAPFDEARRGLAAGSVDLLHIDGCHSYDAVRHDYETWVDALSDDGVVLLHDVAVRDGDFGVYRLWEELMRAHPWAEFSHSYGLGVVFRGAAPSDLAALRDEWRHRYGTALP